jgi:hypothetical protein
VSDVNTAILVVVSGRLCGREGKGVMEWMGGLVLIFALTVIFRVEYDCIVLFIFKLSLLSLYMWNCY